MNRRYRALGIILGTACSVFSYDTKAGINLLVVNQKNEEAIKYVGNTNPANGIAQLELLIHEGLRADQKVLEIGCGALVAGIPIMQYINRGNFFGIDPNKWLIDTSLSIEENRVIADSRKPSFFYNSNFDGSDANVTFDYILAHSIMSHAPLWQLNLFLSNCSKVLKKGGKVIFSLRLTAENPYDGLGIKPESTTIEWQYPGNTFFHKETVMNVASQWFSSIEHKPEYTAIIMTSDSTAFHEWFVATK